MSLAFLICCILIIPQSNIILPTSIRIGSFDVMLFDLLTMGIFIGWAGPFIFSRNHYVGFVKRINKLYLKFLIVGLIPIVIGIIYGKGNLLYAYRFFFYFIWVPVLVDLLREKKSALKTLKTLIIVSVISTAIAACQSLLTIGFNIFYLDIRHEINLFVTLILLSVILSKETLFKNKRTDMLLFLICLLGIMMDQSRKIYLAFSFGCVSLFIIHLQVLKEKYQSKRIKVFSILLVVVLIVAFSMASTLTRRVKSIFISPSQILTQEGVDTSAAFRLYALLSGLQLVKNNPIFGVGSGDAVEMKRAIMLKFGRTISLSPHNFYLSMLLYYGIPIVVWVYSIIILYLKRSLHLLLYSSSYKHENLRFIALGMTIGFGCFMINMFFEGFGIDTIVHTWVFFGLMIGFVNLITNQSLQKQ